MTLPCWKCGALPATTASFSSSLTPQIAHLLNSNDAPLDSETAIVHSIVTAGQDCVDMLTAQISALHAAIDRLMDERAQVKQLVEEHTHILSPIRHLPPELVLEILGRPSLPCTKRLGRNTVTRPPWHLGHICRTWRQWALADPALWNSIELFHSPAFPVMDNSPLFMLETQYLRAANEPLEVKIVTWDFSVDIDSLWLNSFLDRCDQWGTLQLPSSSPPFDLFRPLKSRLSSLHTLESTAASRLPSTDIFSVTPALHTVLLADIPCREASPNLTIPWHQIVHYRGVYEVQHQLEILRAAPNLIACGLGFTTSASSIADQVVALPYLRRLHLKRGRFLNNLEAPVLEQLFMTGEVDTLPSFLHRSSCQLTKLVLTYCTPSPALTDVLHLLPALTDLILEPNPGVQQQTKQLLGELTLSGALSDICPRLEAFSYGDRRLGDVADALFAMVQSRVRPGRRSGLSIFRIWFHSLSGAVAERLKELSDEGLDAAYISHSDAAEWMRRGCP